MIRGISFEVLNEYGKFLEDILKSFKVEDHNWWGRVMDYTRWQTEGTFSKVN